MNLYRHSASPDGLNQSVAGHSSYQTPSAGFGGADPATWERLALASRFRISELARRCAVSVRTLQRHFRKHYDLTLATWLRECRLNQARQQLAAASSIKALSYDLGYKHPSHFTREFKKQFGVPPSLWLSAKALNPSPANSYGAITTTKPTYAMELFDVV